MKKLVRNWISCTKSGQLFLQGNPVFVCEFIWLFRYIVRLLQKIAGLFGSLVNDRHRKLWWPMLATRTMACFKEKCHWWGSFDLKLVENVPFLLGKKHGEGHWSENNLDHKNLRYLHKIIFTKALNFVPHPRTSPSGCCHLTTPVRQGLLKKMWGDLKGFEAKRKLWGRENTKRTKKNVTRYQ